MDYTRERAPYNRTYRKWKKDWKKKGQDMRWTPGKTSNYKQTGTHLRWAARNIQAKIQRDYDGYGRKPTAGAEPQRYNHGRRMNYERKKRNLEANAERFERWGNQEDRINAWLDQ